MTVRERNLHLGGPDQTIDRNYAAAEKVARYEWNAAFSGDPVAVNATAQPLRGPKIPPFALVTRAIIVVITTPRTTSDDGTIALQLTAAGDILATTAALDGTVLDEVNLGVPVVSDATKYVQVGSTEAGVKMVVATHGLTAGRFFVYCWYIETEAAVQTT